MRRSILKFFLSTSAALVGGKAIAATKGRLIEKRLLGSWQSDKERTVTRWKYQKDAGEEKREKFEIIFGKLKLRFSATHIYSEYEGLKEVIPYSVLAQDENSVVIAQHRENSLSLEHIHFEQDFYYVLSGYNVEFFRRVLD